MGSSSRSLTARPIPRRTCVGCGQTAGKKAFVRVVRTPQGSVEVDTTGKRPGRGAYICDRHECWDLAIKKGRLERSLKTSLSSSDSTALTEHADSLAGATQ